MTVWQRAPSPVVASDAYERGCQSVNMDNETLDLLLRGGHINMPDRLKRDLWPHPPLQFNDLVARLTDILKEERWFPRKWRPHIQGEAVYEGGVIEHKDGKYIYRAARAHATNPFVVAATTEKFFSSVTDVACHYLKWDLHLPSDLDGWKVTE